MVSFFKKKNTSVSQTAQQAIHSIPEQGIQNNWVNCILNVLISANCL